MINNFQELTFVASKLNKMPVPYRSVTGRVYKTYYTTHEFLANICLGVGINNSIEKELRNLEDSCLRELGFLQLATFVDVLSGDSIAIFGV